MSSGMSNQTVRRMQPITDLLKKSCVEFTISGTAGNHVKVEMVRGPKKKILIVAPHSADQHAMKNNVSRAKRLMMELAF
jgi:hypothetical protein